MERDSAIYYPQLARLKGNPDVYSWERAARPVSHNTHCHRATCFVCSPQQPVLNEELFTQFTEQLVSQAPRFTKSVKFAKMMLTVLTKYSIDVSMIGITDNLCTVDEMVCDNLLRINDCISR